MDRERCEICWETVPVAEFITLPCEFGHRFMAKCIIHWLTQKKKNGEDADCRCPKCQEELHYEMCDHKLEPFRLRTVDRETLMHDLMSTTCLTCRDYEIQDRRIVYRVTLLAMAKPRWDMLKPGDLIPNILLDRYTPEEHKEKFRQVREEHANIVQGWREEARDLQNKDLGRYLQRMSNIAEYERLEKVGADGINEYVFGALEDEESGNRRVYEAEGDNEP